LKPAEIEELRVSTIKQREAEQTVNPDGSTVITKDIRYLQRHSLLPTIIPQHSRGTSNNNEKNRNSVGSSVNSLSSDLAVFLQQQGSDYACQSRRDMIPSTIRS